MSSTVAAILQRVLDGERLGFADGVTLLRSADLPSLGFAADAVCRRLHPEPFRTFNIDRNINYTNVCSAVCDFCAFYRKLGDEDAYVLDRARSSWRRSARPSRWGATRSSCKGGCTLDLGLEWYEDLLRDIKSHFPEVNIHGFSPPEIHHFTKVAKLPLKTVLERLKAAGLGSLPGGGGEILVDRVRAAMTRGKVMTDDWLNVHRVWHELGGRSTATMMFGHIETLEERVEHLERVRQLQDETGGLTAFISWTFQPDHTEMADVPPAGAFEYLKTQAVVAALPRQRPQHPVVLGDARAQDRPAGPPLRRQRHGEPDDRGERRRLGRHRLRPVARRDQAGDPDFRLHPPPAERLL